ncbi:MAG: acetylglutamate kinase [Trueperaceae bacterium]
MPSVIKYGGNAMIDLAVRREVARTIRQAAHDGLEPVVVHGGGPYIDAELKRFDIPVHFLRGLRVTSVEALVPVEHALTLLGKRLAQEIGSAVALTGRDSGLLRAETFDPELGRVGRMVDVNSGLLLRLLGIDVTPVVACLALDSSEEPLNVNADEVAGFVAGALAAPVVFLTNVAGVLDDPGDPHSRLPSLDRREAELRLADGRIAGGMIPKVESALAALEWGAISAVIADGRDPDGLRLALDGSRGTTITAVGNGSR